VVTTSILPLKLEGAEVVRRGKRLLGPVDLSLGGRGATLVLGPNGAGKTTLLRLMHGIERPSRGDLTWSRPRREAETRQAYVFQQPTLLRRSVVENAEYPLRIRRVAAREARARAEKALADVALADLADQPARALSGGERQKLALARALITEPEVLFLDEPTASLDGRSTREIETILLRVRDAGTRLVMATHDLGQARRLATDLIFLLGGRIHDTGMAETFFDQPGTPQTRAFLNGDIVE
jgi:tungstate transport system ATP-binding protein